MKFFILGSCVTRDMFEYQKEDDYEIVDYYSRTCIRSIVSKPLDINESLINLESPFEKRQVIKDLQKSFFNVLSNSDFDYLVIDFIDERHDLLSVGSSLITNSRLFRKSGLSDYIETTKVEMDINLWEEDFIKFVNKLKTIVPQEKILLHKAMWSKQYIENGTIREFSDQNYLYDIDINNHRLEKYYGVFEKLLPVRTVENKIILADSHHKWGLAPFHYTKEYYTNLYKMIMSIIS